MDANNFIISTYVVNTGQVLAKLPDNINYKKITIINQPHEHHIILYSYNEVELKEIALNHPAVVLLLSKSITLKDISLNNITSLLCFANYYDSSDESELFELSNYGTINITGNIQGLEGYYRLTGNSITINSNIAVQNAMIQGNEININGSLVTSGTHNSLLVNAYKTLKLNGTLSGNGALVVNNEANIALNSLVNTTSIVVDTEKFYHDGYIKVKIGDLKSKSFLGNGGIDAYSLKVQDKDSIFKNPYKVTTEKLIVSSEKHESKLSWLGNIEFKRGSLLQVTAQEFELDNYTNKLRKIDAVIINVENGLFTLTAQPKYLQISKINVWATSCLLKEQFSSKVAYFAAKSIYSITSNNCLSVENLWIEDRNLIDRSLQIFSDLINFSKVKECVIRAKFFPVAKFNFSNTKTWLDLTDEVVIDELGKDIKLNADLYLKTGKVNIKNNVNIYNPDNEIHIHTNKLEMLSYFDNVGSYSTSIDTKKLIINCMAKDETCYFGSKVELKAREEMILNFNGKFETSAFEYVVGKGRYIDTPIGNIFVPEDEVYIYPVI